MTESSTTKMTRFVGLDVHKREITACVLDGQGQILHREQPTSTQTKMARLSIRATGELRRGGSPQGEKCQAKLPGGSRTIKSLDRVYAEESLPPRQKLAEGEQQMLAARNCNELMESIAKDHLVPRKTSTSSN